MIKQISPAAYFELPKSKTFNRPLAKDYYSLLTSQAQSIYWSQIPDVVHLRPGDIISWLEPSNNTSGNTGHVMIVDTQPQRDMEDSNLLLIRVTDSTEFPHGDDSREAGRSGLGSGTIGILVDLESRPLAYRWKGRESLRTVYAPIALGRLSL